MNKYSSKAIKTAATVGMSLAMVLSNVAPVVSNTTIAFAAEIASDKQTAEKAQDVVSKVLDHIKLKGIDYKQAFSNEVVATVGNIKINDTVNLIIAESKNTLATLNSDENKLSATLSGSKFEKDASLNTIATFLANNSSYIDADKLDEEALDFAKFIKGYTAATDKLATYFTSGTFNDQDNNVVYLVAENGVTDNITAAKAAYKVITENEKYLNAVINVQTTLDKVEDFKIEVEDYNAEREDVYNKEYVKELEDTPLVGSTTVYDAVEKEAAIPYTQLNIVESVLKNIKNNKIDELSNIAKYDDVKASEEVSYYIEGLETIIEEMKEVKDLLKSTNADVKAYKKDLAGKVAALVDAADDYLTDNGNDAETTAKYEVALEKALNAFREADATALKNFVEDFIGQFYTLTPKQLNSGKYVVRLENADYGRYVSNADVFNLLENKSATAGLQYLLTTVIDNEDSADTYYDTVVNTVTTVEELLKAVTTDIEGLTLSSTLTDKQAAKVVAARKALNQLVTDGKIATEYASALTSKEKKAVLANAELIEALYFKLIMNGTVTASGWVDKGNGEWDYIAEDGSRPTKWVASGSNWYYVKNGTMLRNSWIASDAQGTRWYYVDDNGVMVSNTTVNGYTFNSYGVWVK